MYHVNNTKFNLLHEKFKEPCDTIEPQQPISRRQVKFSFMHLVTQYYKLFVAMHEYLWLDMFHNLNKVHNQLLQSDFNRRLCH